ncbi:MAG: hypothetical protein J6Y37_02555 [Paludibacteraceae bacterium]|nr:hypothetical protein [Paludibacteraceae bacterium]
MIVHIDCNNFFASCELATRPDLQGKPAVVANVTEAGGGIILALNNEAKAVGLKRGNPIFQVKNLLKAKQVTVFPVNHAKYEDFSRRIVHAVLKQDLLQDFVQYSIDEFFGELPIDDAAVLRDYILKVKDLIFATAGIPVSCGASSTYTLAKVATHYAKRYAGYGGICILPADKYEVALKKLSVSDVWGIGRKSSVKLLGTGIQSAWDFVSLSEGYVRKLFSLTGVRTWRELKGLPSIDLKSQPQQQSIMHSRTFAYMIPDLNGLKKEVSNFMAAACSKLRGQGSVCRCVSVFIATNPHRLDLQQYTNNLSYKLLSPTSDTLLLNKVAMGLLENIYKEGYLYKKAGVVLSELSDSSAVQLDLFQSAVHNPVRSRKLMGAIDAINEKFGMNMIHLSVQGNEAEPVEKKGFKS